MDARSWRCECSGAHYLTITPEYEEIGGELIIEGDFHHTWRKRLSMMKDILLHGHAHTWVGVVLTPESAAEIASALLDSSAPQIAVPTKDDQ